MLSLVAVARYLKQKSSAATIPGSEGSVGVPSEVRENVKASVEAFEERGKERVGVVDGLGTGQEQLGHQPVLEGSPQPLDPSFGLR